MWKIKGHTGKVSDDDGDAGDGGETEVVEGIEIADRLGEWRIPIYHRVLRLR